MWISQRRPKAVGGGCWEGIKLADRTVSVFVVDGTRSARDEICQLLEESKRFSLAGRAGNLVEAVRKLVDNAPQVLLLDIDIPELEDLDVLQEFCEKHKSVRVIGTGSQWDDLVLRPAFQAGMEGFLVKPFEEWELVKMVQTVFLGEATAPESTEEEAEEAHVILFMSPKRGVGQTSIAVNTAVELADMEGSRVCLWDADLYFGDVGVLLNTVSRASVIDLVREVDVLSVRSASAYFVKPYERLWVLTAPVKPEQAELMTGEKMRAVLAFLKKLFRYIVIDAGAGFSAAAVSLIAVADQVVLVSEVTGIAPDVHLTTARNILTAGGLGAERQIVALNRIRTEDLAEVNRFQTENSKTALFFFPNDYQSVTASLNSGEPVVVRNPSGEMGRAISQFAELLEKREKKLGRQIEMG